VILAWKTGILATLEAYENRKSARSAKRSQSALEKALSMGVDMSVPDMFHLEQRRLYQDLQ
jgi:hypothetical protein